MTKAAKVNVTTNYRLFNLTNSNRPLDLPKHRKLKESMQRYGFLPSFPIVVSKDASGQWIIKDGQHRHAIAESLNLPVYWIEESIDFDVAVVNNGQKAWVVRDYAEKWANSGVKAYADLLEFSDRRGVCISLAASLLAGTVSFNNIKDKFHDGKFRIREWELADAVAIMYQNIVGMDARLKNNRLVEALVGVHRAEGFESARFSHNLAGCQEKLKPYATRDGYLEMLEDIYNHRKKVHFPLKVNAINAMRARNPTVDQ